jgi:putative membrane protein insertion efficiency factor
MVIQRLSFLAFSLLLLNASFAQTHTDMIWAFHDSQSSVKDTSTATLLKRTEGVQPQRVFTDIISLYQTFISSQDNPSCMFEPSCSHYGQQALQKYGIVNGVLSTADRFLRCNGLSEKAYPFNAKTNKYVDPP